MRKNGETNYDVRKEIQQLHLGGRGYLQGGMTNNFKGLFSLGIERDACYLKSLLA